MMMKSLVPVAAPNTRCGSASAACALLLRRPATHAVPTTTTAGQLRFYKKPTHVLIAHRRKVPAYLATTYILHTRLGSVAPEIAVEWDTEANPGHRNPTLLSVGDIELSVWKCKVCGSRFELSVEDRVMHGEGCPSCEVDKMHSNAPSAFTSSASNNMDDDDLLPGERRESLSIKTTKLPTSR